MLIDTGFVCSKCGNVIFKEEGGIGTGYGLTDEDEKVCYACCADVDRENMIKKGRICLYLVENDTAIINWCGTLRFKVKRIKKGKHNIAGVQRHAWFNGPDGKVWHGNAFGHHSQIIHCKRTTVKS